MIITLRNMQNKENLKGWTTSNISKVLLDTAKELNIKNSEYFMIIRLAITGKKISPPLSESMEILGKEACIRRLKNAAK